MFWYCFFDTLIATSLTRVNSRVQNSIVQLSLSCRFFGLSPSPSAQLALYHKNCYVWKIRISAKDVLCSIAKYRKLLSTFANWLKTITWFSFGAYPLSLKIRSAQGKKMLGLAKLFQGFRPKPFLCLEHNLLTHIVLTVMVCYVFKVRFNCRIVATKTVEEIIIAFGYWTKTTEIPVELNGSKASYTPECVGFLMHV